MTRILSQNRLPWSIKLVLALMILSGVIAVYAVVTQGDTAFTSVENTLVWLGVVAGLFGGITSIGLYITSTDPVRSAPNA